MIIIYIRNFKNFNVVQAQDLFNFVWQYNQDSNDTYEIKYGDSWENGTTVAKNITTNTYSWKIPTKGTYTFWIKAFNNYNYSNNALSDVIAIQDIPETNTLFDFNLLENTQDGIFENTKLYQNTIKLQPKTNVLWQTTENLWGIDNYYQNNGVWGSEVYNDGIYTSRIYDINAVFDCIVSVDYQYLSLDNTQDVTVQWRYSEDNTEWTDWQLCNLGEYSFRYFHFRAIFHAWANKQIVLNKFSVNMDVVNREIEMDVQTLSDGGLQISYSFIEPPSIVGTVNDNINAYVVIKNKTKTGAQVYTYLNDGTQTSAKVNLRLKGF